MTRDEVLDDVMEILRQEGYADQGETISRLRALKSKPPEKSPEVDRAEGTAILDRTQELGVRILELEFERDALRRQLPKYDCTHTGGSVSDSGGKHCPLESPCLTCRFDRLLAQRDREYAASRVLGTEFDALRQRYAEAQRERAETDALLIAANKRAHDAEAEVSRLKWEAAGSPMQGEHAGDPADCAACADGYPPPPGEPAPR